MNAGAVGDVERQAERAVAELGGGRFRRRRVEVADRDPGSLARQGEGGGAADAAAAAGDRDDFAGERARFLGHVTTAGASPAVAVCVPSVRESAPQR